MEEEYVYITKEWFSLVRQHNKLIVALKIKQATQEKLKAEKSFRASPHKFAENLFNKNQHSGKPTFSADEAQHYFENTYRDEGRNCVHSPPPGLERLQIPSHIFSLQCPTENEIKRSVEKKK